MIFGTCGSCGLHHSIEFDYGLQVLLGQPSKIDFDSLISLWVFFQYTSPLIVWFGLKARHCGSKFIQDSRFMFKFKDQEFIQVQFKFKYSNIQIQIWREKWFSGKTSYTSHSKGPIVITNS